MDITSSGPASNFAAGFHPAPASLAQWERVLRHAQAAARLGQVVISLATSFQALKIAQQLLGRPPAGREDDCVAALVVSHHHLADLQLQEGATDAAAEQLCRAHETLMGLLQTANRGARLQQAAWRHSRETHAGLLRYLADHGPHPAIARALRAGCLALSAPGSGSPLPH